MGLDKLVVCDLSLLEPGEDCRKLLSDDPAQLELQRTGKFTDDLENPKIFSSDFLDRILLFFDGQCS